MRVRASRLLGMVPLLLMPIACGGSDKDPRFECTATATFTTGVMTAMSQGTSGKWSATGFPTADEEGKVANAKVAAANCARKISKALDASLSALPIPPQITCNCTESTPDQNPTSP